MQSFLSSSRLRAVVNLTYPLFAIGSVLLVLAWIFCDFFTDMAAIDLYSWLPLFIILLVTALLMTENWVAMALSLLLVIISLSGLFLLLLVIASTILLPSYIIILLAIVFTILLNSILFWFTRNIRKADGQKKKIYRKKRSFLRTSLSLAISCLFIKSYFLDDPSKRWLLTDLFQDGNEPNKLTLALPLSVHIYDASYLNDSVVAEIRSPKTVAQVIKAVSDAQYNKRKISLSGVRHSMGGQALGRDTLHLDMTHMDFVHYNELDRTVTVGPGATWKQIQTVLSPHGRAVRVMQDSNIFTVGGSLSVNSHGKDPHYGSLIESVNYLKIVTADGKEIRCDRTQNSNVFSAVIGGYGLLGIITEVNLFTTQNSIYTFSLLPAQMHSLTETLESLSKKPDTRLLEAHLSVDRERFLTECLIYKYTEANSLPKPKDDLNGENSTWFRKVVFQASRVSNFGKFLRWEIEKYISPLIEPKTVSRNTAMAAPVRFLQNPDANSIDILQEYFLPTKQVYAFLEEYKELVKKYQVNVLNVTVRKVLQDTNALVSYAQKDMYGFVVYYKMQRNSTDEEIMNAFTNELVEHLISIQATYYLCYGSYYSHSQLITMYPGIIKLLELKTRRDPNGIFTNLWYEKILEKYFRLNSVFI